MIQGRFFTMANILSLLRVPLTMLACFALAHENRLLTFVFMALAILSDALDGIVARATDTVSDWGKILDPLADKIAFVIFAVSLLLLKLVPFWMFAVLIIRDLLIFVGGLIIYRGKRPPSANIWGKLSTLFLSLFMLRQAVFPTFQFPEENTLWNTDLLGLFAIFLIVFSFFVYVYDAFFKDKFGVTSET